MSVLCIGSKALQRIDSRARDSNLDMDIIVRLDDFAPFVEKIAKGRKIVQMGPFQDGDKVMARFDDRFVIEADIAWEGSTAEKLLDFGTRFSAGYDAELKLSYASLDFLYMLKMSHRFKKNSPNFLKTMRDIQFMREIGACIPEAHSQYGVEFNSLYGRRMKDTYNYKHPNLMQKKGDFFDASVNYTYDHDQVHFIVKALPSPAYSLVKGDSHEVFMRKEDFFKAPREVQLLCTLEESYVLSLERAIIPFDIRDPIHQKKAFDTALQKVCSSITSGWFREFSWENYDVVQSMYNPDYIQKFFYAVETGAIKPL